MITFGKLCLVYTEDSLLDALTMVDFSRSTRESSGMILYKLEKPVKL